jgi:hypothetical protein
VPAFPHLAQFLFNAGRAHDVGDLVDVETVRGLLVAFFWTTPLPFAVRGIEVRRDPGKLLAFFRIRRRGHDQRNFQQIQLAAQIRCCLDLVELHGILRVSRYGIDETLIGARIQC